MKKRIPEAEAKSLSSDESCFVANVTDSNMRNDTLVSTADLPLIPFDNHVTSYSCHHFNFAVFTKEVC